MSKKISPALIKRVIKKHGPVIDLKKNPDILIDILRGLDMDAGTPPPPSPDDAGAPVGVPPAPQPPPRDPPGPTPPGPDLTGRGITNEDLMKTVLQLSRDVAALKTSLKGLTPVQKAPAKVVKPR